jgi:type I site-specific restriction endonuclease
VPRKISEELTRKEMIDPQLEKAGWYLRAVQSVFLEKRHLEAADLYEQPLDMFGADAVERWFTEKEVKDVVEFANRMSIKRL